MLIFRLAILLSVLNPSLARADVLPPEEEYIESVKNNKSLILFMPILGISLIAGVVYWKKTKNVEKEE